MSDRRPSRIRKPVNYSGFEDTSDDDFANNTPPPSKKPKGEARDTKSKIKKSSPKAGQKESFSSSNISTPTLDSGKKRRLPVSEKIYERELKEALQISLYETGGSQDVVVHIEDCGSSSSTQEENLKASNCDDTQRKNLSEEEPEKKTRTRLKHNSGTTTFTGIVGTVMDDSIEVLGSLVDNDNNRSHSIAQVTPATRHSQKKKQKSDDESEEDSDLDLDNESEDDENSSSDVSSVENDSDFDDKPKKKRQATKKTKSSPQKTLKPKYKSKSLLETSKNVAGKQPKADLKDNITASSISTSAHHHTVQLSSETVKRNRAISPGTPIASVKASPIIPPSWKPPSRANSGSSSFTTVKSPTTGLRLGLSRNQMTKPLHKSYKVSM